MESDRVPADPTLVEFAADLITRAGEISLTYFRIDDLAVDHKADGSPVTAADRATESFLRDELTRRFPDDAVVGEEFGTVTGVSGRTWVIDPIDGTRSFTKGVPLYTNLLALVDEDGPAIGVVNAPASGEIVVAGRGCGARYNGVPCRVNDVQTLAEATVTTSGYDYWSDTHVNAVKQSGAQMVTWGDGYGYILVATGRAEAMIDPGLAPWDVAPLNVIVPEAGGLITDFTGTPLPDRGNVVATNGHLHHEVLGLLT